MSKNKQLERTPKQVYNLLKDIIEANDGIIAKGGIPVSTSIRGSHGIGKSSICKEIAGDLNRGFFKLNLAQLTEPAELLGYYSKEYQVRKLLPPVKDEKEPQYENLWITENLLPKYVADGYEYASNTRTIPCPPDWVVNLKEGSLLCLDDYSRSNSLFSQAVMELN